MDPSAISWETCRSELGTGLSSRDPGWPTRRQNAYGLAVGRTPVNEPDETGQTSGTGSVRTCVQIQRSWYEGY